MAGDAMVVPDRRHAKRALTRLPQLEQKSGVGHYREPLTALLDDLMADSTLFSKADARKQRLVDFA
jgi:hypothetical protein